MIFEERYEELMKHLKKGRVLANKLHLDMVQYVEDYIKDNGLEDWDRSVTVGYYAFNGEYKTSTHDYSYISNDLLTIASYSNVCVTFSRESVGERYLILK